MPNSGVARLTIGIDTNAAMNMPATNTVPRLARRSALASVDRMKAHRRQFEIFAAEQIGGGEKEDHHAEAGKQQEGQGAQIDEERQQRGLERLRARRAATAARRRADRPDSVRARHARRSRRRKSSRPATSPPASGKSRRRTARSPSATVRTQPSTTTGQCTNRAEVAFDPLAAGARQPDQQPVERDAEHHQKGDRQADRLEQHRRGTAA